MIFSQAGWACAKKGPKNGLTRDFLLGPKPGPGRPIHAFKSRRNPVTDCSNTYLCPSKLICISDYSQQQRLYRMEYHGKLWSITSLRLSPINTYKPPDTLGFESNRGYKTQSRQELRMSYVETRKTLQIQGDFLGPLVLPWPVDPWTRGR